MKLPILVTKLFIPPLQSKTVLRQRLIEKLNDGAKRKLTLVSASAGFGKTLLLSQWIENYNYSVAWISLDQEHNDITRFLIYLLGALQSIDTKIGEAAVGMLLSSQTPSFEAVMTVLINDIANLEDDFSLVLAALLQVFLCKAYPFLCR